MVAFSDAKRRYFTLMEMMVVMSLIAILIGVIGYNYRGALDEGKAFKTKAGMERLESILSLSTAEYPGLIDNIESNWVEVIRKSPLVKDPNSLIYDGWGQQYRVTVEDGQIKIFSQRYADYQKEHPGQ